MIELSVKTRERTEFVLLTKLIQEQLQKHLWKNGLLTLYVPHTTAGITIQENADPDVVHDMTYILDQIIPWKDPQYRHAEGNTASHIKASLMGSSVQVIIENQTLLLGRWQGIFFCEFDGPRSRSLWLNFSPFSS